MFSAFADERLATVAFEQAVVAGFVSKGADPTELVAAVARLLDYNPSSVPPPPPVAAPAGSLVAPSVARSPRPHPKSGPG